MRADAGGGGGGLRGRVLHARGATGRSPNSAATRSRRSPRWPCSSSASLHAFGRRWVLYVGDGLLVAMIALSYASQLVTLTGFYA